MREKAETHLGLWLKVGEFEIIEDHEFIGIRRWVSPDIPERERIDDLVVMSHSIWRSLVAQVRADIIQAAPVDMPVSWRFWAPDGQSVVFENFTSYEWYGLFQILKKYDLIDIGRNNGLVRWPSVVKPGRRDLPLDRSR